jgi:transcriptional regulator with XRE-family HTH domain
MPLTQNETFGDYLRELRLDMNIGIRKFARLINMLPSTYSDIELSRVLPPQEEGVLEEIVSLLGLASESQEKIKLYELAKKDNQNPPPSKFSNAKLIPVFARDTKSKRLGDKELLELTKDLQDYSNAKQIPYSELA